MSARMAARHCFSVSAASNEITAVFPRTREPSHCFHPARAIDTQVGAWAQIALRSVPTSDLSPRHVGAILLGVASCHPLRPPVPVAERGGFIRSEPDVN